MLTEFHITELKTAAALLRADWLQFHDTTGREVMAERLEAVISDAKKWEPPSDSTPIERVRDGWWFVIDNAVITHYVRVGSRLSGDDPRVYGPNDSKHGTPFEDLYQGITFFAAPSPQKVMELQAEGTEVTP